MAELKYPAELISNLQKLQTLKENLRVQLGAPAGTSFEALVSMASGGAQLPELTNPALPSQVVSGYEFIDETGAKQTGTYAIEDLTPVLQEQADLIAELEAVIAEKGSIQLPELTNPAGAAQVLTGYEFIDPETGEAATGTALSTVISATAASVESGKTYYDHTGTLNTGTATIYKYQTATSAITDTSSSSNTRTFTATGNTIDVAIIWLTTSTGSLVKNVGVVVGSTILLATIGSSTSSKISSVSGRNITAVGAPADVNSYGSLTMNVIIVSH